MRKSIIWSVVGILAILAMLVALVPRLLTSNDNTASDQAMGELSVAEVADRPDCAGSALGVELPCLGGENVPATGKKQIVNVWAWWCVPCREELPLLQEYQQNHPEVEVVLVQADKDAAKGAALLDELNITLPSFQDSENLFAGTKSLPSVIPITLTEETTHIQAFTSMEELEAALA